MSASLAAALALALLALGTIWLRQQLGAVSAKHARAEAALRRRDRLAAMGELASTVAHESATRSTAWPCRPEDPARVCGPCRARRRA